MSWTRTAGTVVAGSTSVAPSYPAGVAAGKVAILKVISKPSTTTINTPAGGWQPFGNGTGGTGTTGIDTGPMHVAMFYLELAGTESGTVTVSITSGNSSQGVIDIYAATNGIDTSALAAQTGGDATHNTAWSATMGGTTVFYDSGDLLVGCSACCSNVSTSITSRAVSATGGTFGTVENARAATTNTGQDCLFDTFDFPVTGGPTTGTVTYTATHGANNSGATAIGKLVENVAAVPGAATGDFTFTGSVAGVRGVTGTAAGDETFTGTVAGVRGVIGQATGDYAFTGTVSGQKEVLGAASGDFTFTGTVSGTVGGAPPVEGTASGDFGFAGTVVGVRDVTGQATGDYTLTGTVTGVKEVAGQASGAYSFAGTASGVRGVEGQASLAETFTGSVNGSRGVVGQASASFGFTGNVSGQVLGNVSGTAVGDFGFAGAVAGVRGVVGQATGDYTFTGIASGSPSTPPPIEGAATGPFVFTGTVSGVRGVLGAASAALGFVGSVIAQGASPPVRIDATIRAKSEVVAMEKVGTLVWRESETVIS